ncbi:MAG: branched-chain amino acid aminotransferase [Flavobacteriales bacterium]|nr:branched-chain amino acid aminotransferase [Flavobacteriales bacterium]
MLADTNAIEITKTAQSRLDQVDWENLGFGKIFSDHMAYVEYRDGQWHTPVIKPYGPMNFSPAISALHYGQAIFEGLKAYKNEQGEVLIFRPEKNAERLNISAHRMCMPSLPVETFMDMLTQLINLDSGWIPKGEGESLYIRPHMFAIDEFVGVRPSETYLFVIFTCPVGKYYTSELKVKIETNYTRATKGGTGSAKAAGNYGASLFPTQIAKDAGFDQVLWTDSQTHEYFEESGTMNVMFLSGNKVMSPAISDSILDGITRNSVLQVAKDWGYEVEERKVSVAEIVELLKAKKLDGAFGVGTAATIAPIRIIHHNGTDYEITRDQSSDFAGRMNTYLDRLKRGLEEDKHHWNHKI